MVAALAGHFGSEDAAHLRRRCRRVLARVSPDLLVQRARRARQECGLRRWADEPGVDKWVGTFPTEDAAQAWAAIDALAHHYLKHGACPTIERARAKALTDLVAGNATIDTTLTVTVPAAVLPETTTPGTVTPDAVAHGDRGTGEGDLVEVTGPNGAQPVYVTRSWLTTTISHGAKVQVAPCHPATGALLHDTATATIRTRRHTPSTTTSAARSPSANGRTPQQSEQTWPGPTGPPDGWRPGSRPATGAAASPAAPSPRPSATSTTPDPGRTDPPTTPTCSACAGATTGSNNDSAGTSP